MYLPNIAESLDAFGNRFVNRVFTPREIAYATAGPDDFAGRLAECFAAKEAMYKALGGREAPSWRSIELYHTDGTQGEVRGGGIALPVRLSRQKSFAFALIVGHD